MRTILVSVAMVLVMVATCAAVSIEEEAKGIIAKEQRSSLVSKAKTFLERKQAIEKQLENINEALANLNEGYDVQMPKEFEMCTMLTTGFTVNGARLVTWPNTNALYVGN